MFNYQDDDQINYAIKTYYQLDNLHTFYQNFSTLIELLRLIPALSSLNGDGVAYIHNDKNQKKAWQSYRKGLINNYSVPNENLIVDNGFRSIFNICTQQDINDTDFENLAKMHKKFMLVENIAGMALEEYIATELKEFGWIWCSGNFVQGTDLIQKNSDGSWRFLQVKSRSNTENSSSNKIRELIGNRANIIIKNWYRLDVSQPGVQTLKWDELNTFAGSQDLSEDKFIEFCRRKNENFLIFKDEFSTEIENLFRIKKSKKQVDTDIERVLTKISARKSEKITPLAKTWKPTLERHSLSSAEIENILDLKNKLISLQSSLQLQIESLDREITVKGQDLL